MTTPDKPGLRCTVSTLESLTLLDFCNVRISDFADAFRSAVEENFKCAHLTAERWVQLIGALRADPHNCTDADFGSVRISEIQSLISNPTRIRMDILIRDTAAYIKAQRGEE